MRLDHLLSKEHLEVKYLPVSKVGRTAFSRTSTLKQSTLTLTLFSFEGTCIGMVKKIPHRFDDGGFCICAAKYSAISRSLAWFAAQSQFSGKQLDLAVPVW